ncbi:MAG: nucleotidyltransferase family protein [Paracoccaceae bacterium]|nr:nucleotidyltransferase family protein [Paracoccaceae bacterium]
MPDALMLFAAGFGTRMGALTATRPKPLVEVAGRPLIDHALDLASGAGVGRIVVNTHYLPDQIAAHLAGRGILLSHEPQILETGGGLKAARGLLDSAEVFTLNSDAIWAGPNPLALLRAAWRPEAMDALLLLVPPERARGHRGRGDFLCDATGRLSRGPGLIYPGAQIIKTDAVAQVTEDVFSLNRVWDQILAGRRLYGLTYPGQWCDVGRPEGIAEAEALLREAGHA